MPLEVAAGCSTRTRPARPGRGEHRRARTLGALRGSRTFAPPASAPQARRDLISSRSSKRKTTMPRPTAHPSTGPPPREPPRREARRGRSRSQEWGRDRSPATAQRTRSARRRRSRRGRTEGATAPRARTPRRTRARRTERRHAGAAMQLPRDARHHERDQPRRTEDSRDPCVELRALHAPGGQGAGPAPPAARTRRSRASGRATVRRRSRSGPVHEDRNAPAPDV